MLLFSTPQTLFAADAAAASAIDVAIPVDTPPGSHTLVLVADVGGQTVTQSAAVGSLTILPGNGIPTGTSSINFSTGQTRANNAMVYLATDGTGSIGVQNNSTSTVQFILDVNGYFQ